MATYQLDYYYFDGCPFCERVKAVIEELDINVNWCDIYDDPKHLQKLTSDTGRRTTPVLYINGQFMHESADIIAWLYENQDNLPKNS